MNNTEAEQATNELQKLLRTWLKAVLVGSTYDKSETDEDRLRTLEELCQKGANLQHLENERGLAVIPHVFWSQNLIQFFLDKGMNINSRLENGDTVLHLAICHIGFVKRGLDLNPICDQVNFIKYLLDESADPNITNLRGETAFFELASRELQTMTDYGIMPKLVNLLKERGANFATKCNSDGELPLHVHARNNYGGPKPIIEFFKEDIIDVRTSARLYSATPLMFASKRRKFECCQLLIDRGADINARDLQGYTPLHYAVLNGAHECAESLIKLGADTNAISLTGKDIYSVKNLTQTPFTYGATPTKLVKIYELSGARKIIMYLSAGFIDCVNLLHKAKDVYREFNLQPSQEFLANFELLRTLQNAANLEQVYLSAMHTVVRLSDTEMSKFWNLLAFAPFYLPVDSESVLYFFNLLQFLTEEFKVVEDFASFEMADISTLFHLVYFIDTWLKKASKNEVTPERISHVHSIARLIIACFNKLTHVTNSNRVSRTCTQIYVTQCHVLTSLHVLFADVISAPGFKDNKGLLKRLVNLDVRDVDSNTLLHLILKDEGDYSNDDDTLFEFMFESELISALIDLDFVNVKSRNRLGFEPVQCINWENPISSEEVFGKMAARGAHVDARNANSMDPWAELGEQTLREAFVADGKTVLAGRYDSLQCACARVLAKSVVPYANRVPKKMVEFINMHLE